jgi:acetyl-CoA carboxylase biotin carboxyl carrier protein
MNIKDIEELIKFVAKSGVSEVDLESKDFKISIKVPVKGGSPALHQPAAPALAPVAQPAAIPASPAPVAAAAPPAEAKQPVAEASNLITIS